MSLLIIFSGITGTATMTAFLYLLSYITHKRLKVVKILGTMLTFQTTPQRGLSDSTFAIVTGIAAHYLVGILFAFIWHLLWQHGIGSPTLLICMLYGFIFGAFGILVWRIFFAIHPHPPDVPLRSYIPSILIGHVFFGIGVYLGIHVGMCVRV
ncbi:hypothetical protein [Ohtaekwangia sp.]|uniref:hypothetical protein n=1 Tax=Ohtaekwangia sp. TaxID=2066019 RepID=UPI002F9515B0